MERRKFLVGAASVVALTVTDQIARGISSIDPLLALVDGGTHSPALLAGWVEGQLPRGSLRRQHAEDFLGEVGERRRGRFNSLRDFLSYADNFSGFGENDNHNYEAMLSIAWMSWYAKPGQRLNWPWFIPGPRGGDQHDKAVHALSNMALAYLVTSREPSIVGRVQNDVFLDGIRSLINIVGQENFDLVLKSFSNRSRYGHELNLKFMGLVGRELEIAKALAHYGLLFEILTTNKSGENLKEGELISRNGVFLGINAIFDKGATSKYIEDMLQRPIDPNMWTGVLDREALYDLVADWTGLLLGVLAGSGGSRVKLGELGASNDDCIKNGKKPYILPPRINGFLVDKGGKRVVMKS